MDQFTEILLDIGITSEFNRIKKGERISSCNIPYTIPYLDVLQDYFEGTEEYEKCAIIVEYKNRIKDHDMNYTIQDFVEV